MMGGPESAFKDPRVSTPSPKSPKDMETIGTPTEGSPKTKEGNRDFISKVLENFDFVPEGGLKIKVDVQELSTELIRRGINVPQEPDRATFIKIAYDKKNNSEKGHFHIDLCYGVFSLEIT